MDKRWTSRAAGLAAVILLMGCGDPPIASTADTEASAEAQAMATTPATPAAPTVPTSTDGSATITGVATTPPTPTETASLTTTTQSPHTEATTSVPAPTTTMLLRPETSEAPTPGIVVTEQEIRSIWPAASINVGGSSVESCGERSIPREVLFAFPYAGYYQSVISVYENSDAAAQALASYLAIIEQASISPVDCSTSTVHRTFIAPSSVTVENGQWRALTTVSYDGAEYNTWERVVRQCGNALVWTAAADSTAGLC